MADQEFAGTGRFRVVSRLGKGGMGVVYRVRDLAHDRDVALKILQRFDPTELYRFKHEFRALADVAHPNLVSLYELVAEGNQCFFTMELLDGVSLRGWVWGAEVERALRSGQTSPSARGRIATISVSSPDGLEPWRTEGETPAVRHVPMVDYDRLRPAFRQLVLGVDALHEAGRLHRDIKPSNVLVTREGRVVLLDFGLVTDRVLVDLRESIGEGLIGTPAYMSPEQAARQKIDPASDWYSVGAILYELLTGRVPFEGHALEMIENRKYKDPPPPSVYASVPADLDALCVDLLQRLPPDRPRGPEILRRLATSAPTAPGLTAPPARPSFVGRRSELKTLGSAYAAAREGSTVIVHVHGRSGMGKTALVERFLETIRDDARTTVLSGRCYERESVPYKALDSVIDALSRYLRQLGREAAGMLPRDVRPLARLFPVLKQAEAVAQAPSPPIEIPDPQELRRRAFWSLKELLARIADRGPLVIWIDDLQWGDADSAALLAELVRPPEAPALLLILSCRSEDQDTSPCVRALIAAEVLRGTRTREVLVEPLPPQDARELAAALLPPAAASRAAHVAQEAEGSPLFVAELVRQEGSGHATLEQMLLTRIAQLAPDPRRLLELVSVAGAPIDLGVALRAARAEVDGPAALGVLRAGRLVRAAATAGHLEPYHDRIRETVARNLDAARLRECHAALARSLEASGVADPEALATHLLAAGDTVRAGGHAARAARSAADALAFDRAARLYRMALELALKDDPSRPQIQIELAMSLANAGRGAEAGSAFTAAAAMAPPAQALDLRRRAAEQYLTSGRIREGIVTLRGVLDAIGMRMATTPRRALARLLLGRARIRLRGLSYRERAAAEIDRDELIRIDACRSASIGLSMIDTIQGAEFQARYTLRALRAGEPSSIAVALALEAGHTSYAGGRGAERRAEEIMRTAETLAQRIQQPYALGLVQMVRGIMDTCHGRWRSARAHCDRGAPILRNQCTGATWEIDTCHAVGLVDCFYLGQLGELARRVNSLLEDAQTRGDLYATTALRTWFSNTGWLAADDLDRARREVDRAREQWPYQGFQMQHYWLLHGEAFLWLYAGEGLRTWERIRTAWPAFEGSLLGRIHVIRAQMVHLRGVSALAAAAETPDPAEVKGLLRVVERAAAELARPRVAALVPCGTVLRAGAAALTRNDEAAASLLSEAAQAFDGFEMGLYAAVMRRLHGQLRGGEAGREEVRAAEAWMTAEGIRDLDRLSRMLAPGFRGRG